MMFGIQGNQIVAHQGAEAYILHGTSMDGESPGLAHTIRASPATVNIFSRSTNFILKSFGANFGGINHLLHLLISDALARMRYDCYLLCRHSTN